MKSIIFVVLLTNFCSSLSAAHYSSDQLRLLTQRVLLVLVVNEDWNNGLDNSINQQHNYGQQKSFYKNNNRVDRPKHARTQPIHQPRKHNHEPRCNNRRNQ